jgi:hypothetical protein
MNIALNIMYAFAFILIIVCVLLTIKGTNRLIRDRENIVISIPSTCNLPLEELVKIDRTQKICCESNGIRTGSYYVERTINNETLGFSVIAVPTYYINVCREFCSEKYLQNDDGTITCVNNPEDTILANVCVAVIRPVYSDGTSCKGGAMPIASLGTNSYFALHAKTNNGFAGCENLVFC